MRAIDASSSIGKHLTLLNLAWLDTLERTEARISFPSCLSVLHTSHIWYCNIGQCLHVTNQSVPFDSEFLGSLNRFSPLEEASAGNAPSEMLARYLTASWRSSRSLGTRARPARMVLLRATPLTRAMRRHWSLTTYHLITWDIYPHNLSFNAQQQPGTASTSSKSMPLQHRPRKIYEIY
ncbi:hypothetical protein EI94DRAFT_1790085 [Lactarius quietus]|nr:hypothetical protein EI94DRAFT_1790085 [Lactarius quietus]